MNSLESTSQCKKIIQNDETILGLLQYGVLLLCYPDVANVASLAWRYGVTVSQQYTGLTFKVLPLGRLVQCYASSAPIPLVAAQSSWQAINELPCSIQNIYLPSQLLMKPHSVEHQRKAVTCCVAFMYHICRKGR